MNTNAREQVYAIGAASKATGVNIETIRYYERIGLMPLPRRAGKYRQYDHEMIKRLAFIRRCRRLGFSLNEVREFLRFVDGGDLTCVEVKERTLAHVREVRDKIRDLRTVERVLSEMVDQCDDGAVPGCPIIEALYTDDVRPAD